MLEFKLPAIGEGVVEGEIVRWLKAVGDPIQANEALVEVMTDKATVEIPAQEGGVVHALQAEEGDICEVGQVIALLNVDGAPAAAAPPAPAPAAAPAPAPAAAPAPAPAAAPAPARAAAPAPAGNGQVLATPAARALARESGIDLAAVPNDRGRITKDDVVRAQSQPAVAAAPAATPAPAAAPAPAPAAPVTRIGGAPQPDETIPFRGMRRRIAEGMTKAYSTAVHYTYVEQIDMTKLVELRAQAKKGAAEAGVKLTYLPFIAKACVHALKKFPIVNAMLDEEKAQIVLRKRYSIGVATATEQGLMVPVVHDADRLSLLDIAREITRVSEAARTGTAKLDELTGSTFTITSLGTIGGVLATPILNFPEVGILGVHAIRKQPVVDENDQIVIGHIMNLSISLDHRVVDGFEGASFLQEVRRYLEDPTLLLLSGI